MSRRRHFGMGRLRADERRKARANERARLLDLLRRVVAERPELAPRFEVYLDLRAAVVKEGMAVRDLIYSVVPQPLRFSDMAVAQRGVDAAEQGTEGEKVVLAKQAELERTLPSARDILNKWPAELSEEELAAIARQEAAQVAIRTAVATPEPTVVVTPTAPRTRGLCPRCECELESMVHLTRCATGGR